MIRKLEGILRLAILGMSVYLVYTLYQPQADRLIREVKEQVFTTTEAPEALLTAEKEGQQEKVTLQRMGADKKYQEMTVEVTFDAAK